MLSAIALCLGFGSAVASPQGQIVVYGTDSGSHLRLTTSGNRLVVSGWMAPAKPTGCKFASFRKVAVCPLANAGSVEVDMGSSPDMVEVLDRLPVPLVARLGDGSDRFIGNGEPDTCYSEGSRRNRCIGGGGDDVCITGNQNSDCVGDGGDDYCQTGAGHDGCHGEAGEDRLYGGADADQLYGGPSYDHCDGLPGWGQSHECETGPRR